MNRRARHSIGWASGLLFTAGVVTGASFPTGAAAPAGVVPAGSRIAATAVVRNLRAFAVVYRGALRAEVAYHQDKGWFGVLLDRAPGDGAPVAWAATRGGGPLPALAVVYGRLADDGGAEPSSVVVRWRDGHNTTARVRDRAFVVARAGGGRAAAVRFRAADGTTVLEVPAP